MRRAAAFVSSLLAMPGRRRLEELRERWGKGSSRDPWLASRYFELITAGKERSSYVDDRTWNDLEFPRIFADMDTTVTRLGSQFLYSQLRIYPDRPSSVPEGYRTYRALAADANLRERIQLTLAYLSPDSYASVAENLFGTLAPNLKHRRFLTLWSATAVILTIATAGLLAFATAIPPLSIVPFLIMLALNFAIIGRMAPEATRLTDTLGGIYRLTRVAEALSRIETTAPVPQLRELASARAVHGDARRAFRTFSALQKTLALGIPVWLNLLFLWEWVAYMRTHDRLAGLRRELRPIFTLVASLDAAVALASFLHRFPEHCRPSFAPAIVEIDAGRHPLLASGVPNSISLRNRSALVTGSNMAGKTTFIKMIATNLILARTIGICFASRAVFPLSGVRACIHSEHSIASGKSHYFSELEAMKSFFDEATGETPPMFVIDEPFSGTNTVERIAAAKEVLDVLSRHSPVLATTHDVELQDILKHRFDMFHFTENPDVEGFFDFRIRTGACGEGNALRLLAKIGFPAAITAEAARFAASFAARRGAAKE